MGVLDLVIQVYMIALCLIFVCTAVLTVLYLLLGFCVFKLFRVINRNNKDI